MELSESQVRGPGEVHDPSGTVDRICFDLDGVLAQGVWPEPRVGPPILEGVALLRRYAAAGFECIIFTSRPADHKQMIYNWLLEHGLEEYVYEVRTDKPLAALYVDDKAYRPEFV